MGLFKRKQQPKGYQPAGMEPEECPPNCQKCIESESIDPDYVPSPEES
ncbi:hypothetical protein [Streptomyces zaomyceticus]|nr:hypothetical protein OG237_06500 [Streptomyces zaomyceticus]